MFISDTAIKRPVLTIVAMLLFVVFGLVALVQLDTDEYPEIDAPVVVIAIPYPGASPDVVEREVIDPIEEVISGVSGDGGLGFAAATGVTLIRELPMARDSVCWTACGSSPGRIRQFTFAVARCASALGACPALAIVATHVVRSMAL